MKRFRPVAIALVWGFLIGAYFLFDRAPDTAGPVDPSQLTEEERRYTALVDAILLEAGYLDRMSERFPDAATLQSFALGPRLTSVLYSQRPGLTEEASRTANARAFNAGRTAAETDDLDEAAIDARRRQMVSLMNDELAPLYEIVMR